MQIEFMLVLYDLTLHVIIVNFNLYLYIMQNVGILRKYIFIFNTT